MIIRKANMEYIFHQCIKSGDGKLAGIQIEIWCTHANLGHPCTHITNLTAKYLELNKIEYDEICESCFRGSHDRKTSRKR